MRKSSGNHLLFLSGTLLAGVLICVFLFQMDNKYTAALSGGYGYNVLQDDLDQVAFLVDGWEYYPGSLLDAEDFSGGISAENYTYIGQYPNFSAYLDSPYGTATYRILLENKGEATNVALYLPELLCAGRIYINGVLVGEQGSIEPYDPWVTDGIYTFQAEGTTEIIVQCANYTHYYSGMYYPPAVGSLHAIERMITLRLLIYGLLCFSSLSIALSHLIRWLLGWDKLTRWMGLLCLAFSLRVCYPFLRAMGIPVIRPLYALEDVCGSAVLLFAILLAGELAGVTDRPFHKRFCLPAAAALCAANIVFPLFVLPYVPSLINFYGILLFIWKLAAGIYLIVLAGRTLDSDRPLGRYLLCTGGAYGMSIAASVILANRFEPICGAWLEEYGGFALVMGFSAVMIRWEVLLTRENRHLTLYLQEEVDHKTQWMETLLAERRELLANLLHDLKNPLAALRSYAELVRRGGIALDDVTASYLDALTERAGAVEKRFDILQSFSRGERRVSSQEPILLNAFLRQFYLNNQLDMEITGVDFHLKLPSTDIIVRGDKGRLNAALENLCYNALSFTPENGTVTLALKQEESYAVITVQYTGIGIPAENLAHIFDCGFTDRIDDSGDGLGLYIVRTIALEHGGTVNAVSQEGKGSVFTLRLPIYSPDRH